MTIDSPNFTQIPNVVFDYWIPKLQKPGSALVLLVLCRKIFGWHKTSDHISKNQLCKTTGLSKNTVQSAIEELQNHGLLLKHQHRNEYGHQPNTYSLSVEKPLDVIYTEQDQNLGVGRSEIDLGVGQKLTQGVGQKLTPQKKDSTKQRLTKESEGVDPPSPPTPPKIQRAPHVFSTEDEHQKLLNKFGEENTEIYYQHLSQWKVDTPRSKWKKSDYHAILRWVIDAVKEANLKEKKRESFDSEDDNFAYAKKIAENYNLAVAPRKGIRLDALSTHLEIIALTAQCPPACIPYKEKGFKEQVENALRKWRLK